MKKNKVKYWLLILLLGVSTANGLAQGIEQWWAYPSQRAVNDVVKDKDGIIWGATNGGIFKYEGDSNFTSLTMLQGLSRQDGRVITYDENNGRVIVGYVNGIIDLIEIDGLHISTLRDIARTSSFSSKGINDFVVYNNDLYAATDFGIVVIDLEGLYVKESFIQLGNINRAASVLEIVIKNNKIYCGTEEGVAVGDLSEDLSINSNWESHNNDNGFVPMQIQAIDFWNDQIVASTPDSNYIYDGLNWQVNQNFNSVVIEYAELAPNQFIALSKRYIYHSINEDDFISTYLHEEIATSFSTTVNSDNNLYFGTLNKGVGVYNFSDGRISYRTPEGPYQNLFSGLTVNQGTLVSASNQESSGDLNIDNGKGYYIYENGEWKNFNKQNNETLRLADFRQTLTTTETENYYYIGSWGQGVARHHKETDSIYVFNEKNSIIRGWEDDDPLYPVISGLSVDSNDDVWMVSRFGSNPLYYQEPGADEWIDFEKYSSVAADEYFKLFIDSHDQKWITLQNTSAAGRGIVVLNTGNPEDASDDTAVKLTTNPEAGNLPDQQVKAIVEDKNGEIWVGTQRGIAKFIFPELLIEGGPNERRGQWLINEDTTASSRYLIRDVNVSAMAVNAANEKWIGTENQGIFVVNPEGSRIIKRFTSENSFLYSDNIHSIAIDDETGEVFIATDMGLISFLDVPKTPNEEMGKLKVFPNPFNYAQHSQILIEGLSEETTIKILGVDGNVVNEIIARGGRTSWDGLSYSGKQLGSGVYFIVAYDEDGASKGLGKVVIIR